MHKVQVWLAVAVTVLYSLLSCLDEAVYAVSSKYDAREEGVEGYANGWRD